MPRGLGFSKRTLDFKNHAKDCIKNDTSNGKKLPKKFGYSTGVMYLSVVNMTKQIKQNK